MTENMVLKKSFLKKEMIFMFKDSKKLESLLKKGYHKTINKHENLFTFLTFFLEKIFGENCLDGKKLLFIIDNFDDEKYDEKEINRLLDLCKNNFSKITIIISGTGKFLREKRNSMYINKDTFEKEEYIECPLYDTKEIQSNVIPHFIYNSPKYYFKYISDTNTLKDIHLFSQKILKEEVEKLSELNFYGKYFCLINEKEKLAKNKLNGLFDIIPSNYLFFNFDNNKVYFTIQNEIIRIAFKKTIDLEVKEKAIRELINSPNTARTEIGVYNEKLLTIILKVNKVGLNNLNFNEDNILEVEELYDFRYCRYDKYGIKRFLYSILDLNPFNIKRCKNLSYHFKLNKDDLYLNKNHQKWYNIENKKQSSNKSFEELYEIVTKEAANIINELYEYIYNNKKISLEKLIGNISYSKGIPIE